MTIFVGVMNSLLPISISYGPFVALYTAPIAFPDCNNNKQIVNSTPIIRGCSAKYAFRSFSDMH